MKQEILKALNIVEKEFDCDSRKEARYYFLQICHREGSLIKGAEIVINTKKERDQRWGTAHPEFFHNGEFDWDEYYKSILKVESEEFWKNFE